MDETPEQIHARLMGLPAPAESAKAPEEPAPSEGQHDDEDPAMKEAREKVNTYRNLHSLSQQSSDSESYAHPGRALADNALGMLEGLLAGKVVRSGLGMVAPEGFMYNPDLPKIQNELLPGAEKKLGEYHNTVMDELDRRNALREQHIQEGHDLKNEASSKRFALEQTERELADARRQHLAAHALEPEHFLPPDYSVAPEEPAHERVGLTTKPLGGTATEKYALSYGATPEEAKLVASPSVMQKQNIPFQAGALERLRTIGEPNVVMAEESPLALNPAAQKAVEERKAEEQRLAQRAKADQDFKQAQRQAAVKQVAQAKLEAEQRVKALETQHANQLKEAQQAEKEHKAHMRLLPAEATPSPAEKSSYQTMMEEVDNLQNKINKQIGAYGKYGNMFAKIGTKIAPRFAPIYGSAMAIPQAEAASEEFKRGNKIKGGLYTLGSIGAAAQATGNPFLMGLGDIAQIPAAGLGIYDIMNEKPAD